MTNLSVTAAV